MKISEEFFRSVILERLKTATAKIRTIDDKTYSIKSQHEIWRLSRDAALILESVIEGIEIAEE